MFYRVDRFVKAVGAGGDCSPARSRSTSITVLVLPLLAAAVIACHSESARQEGAESPIGGNHPPAIREASVRPDPVRLEGALSVQVQADDPDRDPLTFHHQWIVNGERLAGQTASTLPPTVLKRGDAVAVELVPDDGKVRGAPFRTAAATVVNTPPRVVSLEIHPHPALSGDRLEAKVEASDADGDRIDLLFRWARNGAIVKEGDDPALDTEGFSQKDVVTVEVTPRDRMAAGVAFKSGSLLASNSPPVIVSKPSPPTGREQYEYDVNATDPEGDRLTYRLETAPPGMTIDVESGRIRWSVAPTLTGTHHVRVVVEDISGGTAFQEFDLNIAAPALGKPEGA